MPTNSTDRNLLFGILALQLDFISRDSLIAAMNTWVLSKQLPIGQILVTQGKLTPERLGLLDALVAEHLRQHNHSAEQSLAALSSLGSARRALEAIKNADVQASLSRACAASREDDSYPTKQPSTAEYGAARGPRYRVLRPHAKGGLGEVLVAEDTELHREVALKEIQARHAHDVHSRGRFLLEAEVTGQLEHPGIVPVYGLGSYADGRPFYAMRFIKGDNLKHAIDRFHKDARAHGMKGPAFASVPFHRLLGRFLDVCNAVAYAHSRGVLHRDLKPGNIMLGEFGETLVVDWGLAKVTRSDSGARRGDVSEAHAFPRLHLSSGSGDIETVTGAAIGTPAFMSPEQAEGKLEQLGPATDVYSLGATLYNLLTSQPPVTAKEPAAALEKVRRGDILPPASVQPDVPPALSAICMKALALRPGDRYSTPLALATDVEHWLVDEAVSACPEPVSARMRRWTRKHRTFVTGVAAALVVLTISSVIGAGLLGAAYSAQEQLNSKLEFANQALEATNAVLKVANQREQSARRVAEEALGDARAFSDFMLKDALAVARPEGEQGGLGIHVTVRRALEEAAKNIGERFRDRPRAEAMARHDLGETYFLITELKLAEGQFQEALRLRRKLLPAEHQDILETQNSLALTWAQAGRPEEARTLFEATLETKKANLGLTHRSTLTTMNNLANTYLDLGQRNRALELFEEAMRMRKAAFGPTDTDTLQSMNNLALMYQELGRRNDALALLTDTWKILQQQLGPAHPTTLNTANNVAHAYQKAGRLDAALPLFAETLKLQQEKLGAMHRNTLTTMSNLANAYLDAGRGAEALALFQETLALQRNGLGPEHPDMIVTLNGLALAYQTAGRHREALPLFEEGLRLHKQILGPTHPNTLASMHNLAFAYQDAGKLAEAVAMLEETVKLHKEHIGATHADTLICINSLAGAYLAAGRLADARPLYADTLAHQKAQLGGEHPDVLLTMYNLGLVDLRLKDYAKAEPVLLACQAAVEAKRLGLHPNISRGTTGALVRLYERWGKSAEAEKWRAKLPPAARIGEAFERQPTWSLLWGWPRF
jgi:serine/threonine protein kinase